MPFHLDHIRTKVAQKLRTHGPLKDVAKVNDPNPLQGFAKLTHRLTPC